MNEIEKINDKLVHLFVSEKGNLPDFLQTKESRREWMTQFEEMIREQPNAEEGGKTMCPLHHTFADGMYARTGFMPQGSFIAGKIHRYETINILHSGRMAVITEDGGLDVYEAPHIFRSPSGCRKSLYIIEDCHFTNVNRNRTDTRDLDELEADLIVGDIKELESYERGSLCG